MATWTPSKIVVDLQQELADHLISSDYQSDWGRQHAKDLRSAIRAARLSQARALGTHTDDEWQAILEEFDYRCVRCGCTPHGRPCKDHILPIYIGGSDSAKNLQPLCRQCNTAKGPDSFNWAEFRRAHGFDGSDSDNA
jgi:5-methylcytosine-specific restriction endonuclease McrA